MFQATILLWTVCYIAQAFFDWRPLQLIVLNQAKLIQGILHITTELAYLFHSYDQTDCPFFLEEMIEFRRNSNDRFDLENSSVKTLQWRKWVNRDCVADELETAQPAQNQPKSQFLFQNYRSPRNLDTMTLDVLQSPISIFTIA